MLVGLLAGSRYPALRVFTTYRVRSDAGRILPTRSAFLGLSFSRRRKPLREAGYQSQLLLARQRVGLTHDLVISRQ
jgi:hypothetical protein